jgi:two-component system, OmpR family, sensor kinase
MLLRFFLTIWLSIMLCIVGIAVIDRMMGESPNMEFAEAYRHATVLDLTEAAILDDSATARRLIALAANLEPAIMLSIETLPDCSRAEPDMYDTRMVTTPERCLLLTASGADPSIEVPGTPTSVFLIGALLIGAVAALLLARRFMRPITTLSDGFRALSRGEFSARIGDTLGRRRDEMGRLAMDFDLMAGRLETLSDARRRLFHDVSHELRSPLARLQAAAGVLRQSPAKLGPMLARIEAEIGKLDHLVDEILTLARLEYSGTQILVRQRVDLVDLLAPIVADAAFEGQERGVGCSYDGPGGIEGEVDPELFHRALENVIRNAVRHTADGTQIEVRARVSADVDGSRRHLTLTVEDRGPGVAVAEIESIFVPFQRAADTTKPGGAGLGLAIARRAMEVHGGAASAAARAGGGLVVTLSLPLRTP